MAPAAAVASSRPATIHTRTQRHCPLRHVTHAAATTYLPFSFVACHTDMLAALLVAVAVAVSVADAGSSSTTDRRALADNDVHDHAVKRGTGNVVGQGRAVDQVVDVDNRQAVSKSAKADSGLELGDELHMFKGTQLGAAVPGIGALPGNEVLLDVGGLGVGSEVQAVATTAWTTTTDHSAADTKVENHNNGSRRHAESSTLKTKDELEDKRHDRDAHEFKHEHDHDHHEDHHRPSHHHRSHHHHDDDDDDDNDDDDDD